MGGNDEDFHVTMMKVVMALLLLLLLLGIKQTSKQAARSPTGRDQIQSSHARSLAMVWSSRGGGGGGRKIKLVP